ncbi:unnamed protein product [Phytophthora lilii]|uniref:Unnamed protein product n=1 Tax=Phytophthora lilii TaxID=2077276 RepID=A0A9W7CJZ3_9STRA|nr:unnamed protein product [Phytophthora lilii]
MSWAKHKKILAMAKGYRGRANSCYRTAINRVEKGLQYQYRDRKQKKRLYGKMNGSGIELNRKVLADIAATEPFSFKSVLEVVKHMEGITKAL